MSESEEEEQQHPQSSGLPTDGYEAAEEERRSLEDEKERNTHVASQEQEQESSLEPAKQEQKRDETRGKRRRRTTTTIGATASAWQVTLFDLDKQLNRQRAFMERMADDVKHLRKQFNQVQRDLAKFQKRMNKMRTTASSTKRGKRRG
jgi:chromosome segregation ATPase